MSTRKIKQIAAYLFAFSAMTAYLMDNPPPLQENTVSNVDKETVEIVLLDQKKQCVPFSLSTDAESLDDKISVIVEAMKVNQTNNPAFTGLFPSDLKVNSVNQNDNLLKIDFNEAILAIDPARELKVLEAMSYVFTQFDGFSFFEFTVENQSVDQFASGLIEIHQPLDGSLLMNNFETIHSTLHRTKGFSIVRRITQNDQEYYTVQSIRSKDSMEKSLEDYYTRSNSIMIADQIQFQTFDITQNEEQIRLGLSAEILTPQKSCDMELIYPILLTIHANYDVNQIEVFVENVSVLTINTEELKFNEI